jgi:predicted Zn-dependent protease
MINVTLVPAAAAIEPWPASANAITIVRIQSPLILILRRISTLMRTFQSALRLVAALACVAGLASAGTPGDAPPAGLREQAAAHYAAILADLARRGRLDDDELALARVRRIFAGLVAAAPAVEPAAAGWSWEAHVASDPAIDAFCLPGGKLVIGSRFLARLELDDAELATLIAHEAAHALAGHRRAPASDSMEMDVGERLRLAGIAFQQETEADEIGMRLAHLAGWPPAGMLRFYEKLAAAESHATFSGSHPSAALRLDRARKLASRLVD